MPYTDLIHIEPSFTKSVNLSLDINDDNKLGRYIPNETSVMLLKNFFVDTIRKDSQYHSKILYGSYGTGKSHALNVLSLLLAKEHCDGVGYHLFNKRLAKIDYELADVVDLHVKNGDPFLVVPIVYDFPDFTRCIYFSLRKMMEKKGINVVFDTFYSQALTIIEKWKSSTSSKEKYIESCRIAKTDDESLVDALNTFDPESEKTFQRVYNEMSFGMKYIYEANNLMDVIEQVSKAIRHQYGGIVFVFDEFGRYLEDNIEQIRVKQVQDLSEYCDHSKTNTHLFLISHKEISQYTSEYSKKLANEWRKVEGRFKAFSINDQHDQCVALATNILQKQEDYWNEFTNSHTQEYKQYLINTDTINVFLTETTSLAEACFPLHPITLYMLDKLSKRIAQNERTFFTYLSSKESNSFYSFLSRTDINEFHFAGIDEIFDYFEDNIRNAKTEASYDSYKMFLSARSKCCGCIPDCELELRILKAITIIAIVNDSAVPASTEVLQNAIDAENVDIVNSIDRLIQNKILKYSNAYKRYEFYEASTIDIDGEIANVVKGITNETCCQVLNEEFVDFVLYPYDYNMQYHIKRTFVPYITVEENVTKKIPSRVVPQHYDGLLILVLGTPNTDTNEIIHAIGGIKRSVGILYSHRNELLGQVRYYCALMVLAQKGNLLEQDPSVAIEIEALKSDTRLVISQQLSSIWNLQSEYCEAIYNGTCQPCHSLTDISRLASNEMCNAFGAALIVNNDLVNKNVLTASMTTARKNAINAIISGSAEPYFGLQYLSPEYLIVRSVLAKNSFISDAEIKVNPSGKYANGKALKNEVENYFLSCKKTPHDFSELINMLQEEPFGTRLGYLPVIVALYINMYKDSILISNHGNEKEVDCSLICDMVENPNDYTVFLPNWNSEQKEFLKRLESVFSEYSPHSRSQNRLAGIYKAMNTHFKSVSKIARTTNLYVSDLSQKYRDILSRNCTDYNRFIFNDLASLGANYDQAIVGIEEAKNELENIPSLVEQYLVTDTLTALHLNPSDKLGASIHSKYIEEWESKRQKSFDYYTNAFMEYASKVTSSLSDCQVVEDLGKLFTSFDVTYWNDGHRDDYQSRLAETLHAIDAYQANDQLENQEVRLSLETADGQQKTKILKSDQILPGSNGIVLRNKLRKAMQSFGTGISYEDKISILVSLINEMMN